MMAELSKELFNKYIQVFPIKLNEEQISFINVNYKKNKKSDISFSLTKLGFRLGLNEKEIEELCKKWVENIEKLENGNYKKEESNEY
jgi:thiol-disulfide isomerase/thioredoxin